MRRASPPPPYYYPSPGMAEENQRADPGEDQRLPRPAQPVTNDVSLMSLPNFEFNGSMPTGNFKVQVGPDTCHFVAGKMFYSLLGLLVVGAVAGGILYVLGAKA